MRYTSWFLVFLFLFSHHLIGQGNSTFSVSGYVFEEPYDFESISHYDPFAASRSSNLKTIEIVRPQDFHYYDVMGLKDTFSDSDIKAIKKMYSP